MTFNASLLRQAREGLGWSQADLAREAGVSQQAIGKLEAGTARSTKFLGKIATAVGIPPQELDPDYWTGGPPSIAPERVVPALGPTDLPVFSGVEGGPGAMVVSTEPIDIVARPWFLREVRDGYGVVVHGESMSPVYEPGDIVIVNPRLPAIRGKNAIFCSSQDGGDFRAAVKRLERITPDDWHVRQWNPPEGQEQQFVLSREEWPIALRIVGKYEG